MLLIIFFNIKHIRKSGYGSPELATMFVSTVCSVCKYLLRCASLVIAEINRKRGTKNMKLQEKRLKNINKH